MHNEAHAQIPTTQNRPDIHTRLLRSTHHSVCLSSSSLTISYDTNIIPIYAGSDDWLGILKDLHRNINMEYDCWSRPFILLLLIFSIGFMYVYISTCNHIRCVQEGPSLLLR